MKLRAFCDWTRELPLELIPSATRTIIKVKTIPWCKVHSSIKMLASEDMSTNLRSMMAAAGRIAWFSMNRRDREIQTHKIENDILWIIPGGVGGNYGNHSGWIYCAGFHDYNHDRQKSGMHSKLFQLLLALPNLECDEPCGRFHQPQMNVT